MTIPSDEGVVDLGEVRRRADERDALEAAAAKQVEDEATMLRAYRWDRDMKRAFKGILPAPERRKAMLRAARRAGA